MTKNSTFHDTSESRWLVQTGVDMLGNGLTSSRTELQWEEAGYGESPDVTWESA